MVVLPTAIVAEMLPLVNHLFKVKFVQHTSASGSPQQVASRTASASASSQTMSSEELDATTARQTLINYAVLVAELLHASAIDLNTGRAGSSSTSTADEIQLATAAGDESAAAAESARDKGAAALLACGTPSAPRSFLHSQDVFAAHAVDTIAVFEGAVRFTCNDWGRTGPRDGKIVDSARKFMPKLTAAAVLLARQAGLPPAEVRQCYSFLASVVHFALT